jgi:hypothetical protein
MGNSPSTESAADNPPGSTQEPPAGLLDSEQEFTYQEIVTPPPAMQTAGQMEDVIV